MAPERLGHNLLLQRWIASCQPRAERRCRLFCFPYAGGSAACFRQWPELLPSDMEVCPIELPGRGHRFSELPPTCLRDVVQDVAAALAPLFAEPFALFGHSLGATLAFELARRLAASGKAAPQRLFLSGQRAPHRPDPKPPLHDLPDHELLEEIRGLGGTPPELFAHPELRELFLPILRADFALGETWVYVPAQPLACPLSVFGGLNDPEVGTEDLLGWREYTAADCRIRHFVGDHFFLQQSQREVTAAIAEDLGGP